MDEASSHRVSRRHFLAGAGAAGLALAAGPLTGAACLPPARPQVDPPTLLLMGPPNRSI